VTLANKYRRLLGRRLLAAALIVKTLVLAGFAIYKAGTWLIIEDPLQPARAIVVFGGEVPFRAMEGARLYKRGWASEVWLTQGGLFSEDIRLGQLGIERMPEHAYSRAVLERMGVPVSAIRVLRERDANTADEVRTIARDLDRFGGDRVILVTSSYHSRRVKFLWHTLVGKRPEAIVRYTRDEPFDARRWWRDSADAMAVAREWSGLLNAELGFPIKSAHW
jgi:uncharacterized SAM-binding protein YcdF (DUF218 family)